MGTSDPKPLTHGGISEAAAVSFFGPGAAVTQPAPPPDPVVEGGDETADPWDDMMTHAAIDGYAAENDLATPIGWSAMTLAQKKAWLDDNA